MMSAYLVPALTTHYVLTRVTRMIFNVCICMPY